MSTLKDHWRVSKSFSKRTRTTVYRKPVPRQDSPNAKNAKNCTLYHPDQAQWTWESMPDIIYQLKPEGKCNRNEEPPYLSYKIHGKPARDLPVLPDNISSTVEEFRVEAWMRLDRRIRLKDITDRIHPDFRLRENALQQRGVRFRQAFGLLAWDSGNRRSLELEYKLLHEMEILGLDTSSNSTRGITPGLIDPKAGEAGGRVPIPAGWGPNKSPRCKKIQYIETELLREPTPEFESSEPETKVKKEPTADLDPSGFEAYMRSIEEPYLEDRVKETEAMEPMKYKPDVERHTLEELHEPEARVKYSCKYIPYNEYQPCSIADEALPSSVRMSDLNLSLGYISPTPEQRVSSFLTLNNIERQDLVWSSTSFLSPHGFCPRACFGDRPQQEEELLQPIRASPCVNNKPQTPNMDLFEFINPIQLETSGDLAAANDFDRMLDGCHSGQRQLIEMPPFSPLPSCD
ncbi:hypothetical protein BJX64DRAFT_285102 [Aspergillus heterothallicus]